MPGCTTIARGSTTRRWEGSSRKIPLGWSPESILVFMLEMIQFSGQMHLVYVDAASRRDRSILRTSASASLVATSTLAAAVFPAARNFTGTPNFVMMMDTTRNVVRFANWSLGIADRWAQTQSLSPPFRLGFSQTLGSRIGTSMVNAMVDELEIIQTLIRSTIGIKATSTMLGIDRATGPTTLATR